MSFLTAFNADIIFNKSGGTPGYHFDYSTGISTYNGILRTTNGQVIHNYQYQDNDYELRKNGSGIAHKYDAGLDQHTLNGEIIINGEKIDKDLIHYDKFGNIAYQYNAGLLNHIFNGIFEIGGSGSIVLNSDFQSRNVNFNKVTSGTWLSYLAAVDQLIINTASLLLTPALAVSNGGTAQTSYTNGQLLIGKADNTLAKSVLTEGAGVSVTNGDGTITIAATGVGVREAIQNPTRTGVTTSVTLTSADTGSLCINANCNTVGDNCDFTLPIISSSNEAMRFRFLNSSGEKLTITCGGSNTIRTIGNRKNSASTFCEFKNSYIELTNAEDTQNPGVWTLTAITNQWSGLTESKNRTSINTDHVMDYLDVGSFIENNANASAILTFSDAFNTATDIGACGWVHRTYGSDTATIQFVTTGSQVIISREPNNYIANTSSSNNNIGSAYWQKAGDNEWMISGDISAASN